MPFIHTHSLLFPSLPLMLFWELFMSSGLSLEGYGSLLHASGAGIPSRVR